MEMAYVIVIDTLCDGHQAWGQESGLLEIYNTEAEAQAEIDETFADLRRNQIESGITPDEETDEFVLPLHEYVRGKKTII
jgi:hypothetical protein